MDRSFPWQFDQETLWLAFDTIPGGPTKYGARPDLTFVSQGIEFILQLTQGNAVLLVGTGVDTSLIWNPLVVN